MDCPNEKKWGVCTYIGCGYRHGKERLDDHNHTMPDNVVKKPEGVRIVQFSVNKFSAFGLGDDQVVYRWFIWNGEAFWRKHV